MSVAQSLCSLYKENNSWSKKLAMRKGVIKFIAEIYRQEDSKFLFS